MAGLYKDKLRVLKVDSDEEPRIASALKVYGLPTIFFVKVRVRLCFWSCPMNAPRTELKYICPRTWIESRVANRTASSCTAWRAPCPPRSSPSSSTTTCSAPRRLKQDFFHGLISWIGGAWLVGWFAGQCVRMRFVFTRRGELQQ